MNKPLKYLILMTALLLFPFISWGQTSDAGLWLSINIEKKITPLLSINFDQELRMNENITEAGTIFSDIGISYKINKYIRVSANYRFTNKRRMDDSYSNRHRYYFDLMFRKKFKPVTISFRTRFQSQYADVYSSKDGKIPQYYSRNKLSIKYDFSKKIQPYVSVELFSPLKYPFNVFMDDARYCIGTEYVINRMHALDFFYLFQKEYKVKNPLSEHIIGIGYSLSL